MANEKTSSEEKRAATGRSRQNAKRWHLLGAKGDALRYTAAELLIALAEERISANDQVWTSGMDQWAKLGDINLEEQAKTDREMIHSGIVTRIRTRSTVATTLPNLRKYKSKKKFKMAVQLRDPKYKRRLQIFVSVAICAALGTFLYKQLNPYAIPELVDTFEDEYKLLESNLKSEKPNSQVAISKKDSTSPVFYISAPIPDGEVAEVLLYGVEGTLVGKPRIVLRQEVKVQKGFGSTTPFTYKGKPLPQGEYRVFSKALYPEKISAISNRMIAALAGKGLAAQEGLLKENFSQSSYFLGGLKDSAYEANLLKYKQHVKSEVGFEQAELKDLYEKQLNAFVTLRTLHNLDNAKVSTKGSSAEKYFRSHQKELEQSLIDFQEAVAVWQTSVILNEYFKSEVYLSSRAASELLVSWIGLLGKMVSSELPISEESKLLFNQYHNQLEGLLPKIKASI